jgi:ligand-binding sensor domain-containing protein
MSHRAVRGAVAPDRRQAGGDGSGVDTRSLQRNSRRVTARAGLRALVSLIVASLPGRGALALDPAKAITQYAHDVWRDRDGLPQNTVQAIVQTRDGYLWLGTEAGLARFDGARFTVFDRKNTPELGHDHILALHESRDGGLWIGTRRGGLLLAVRRRGGKARRSALETGVSSTR